METSPNMGLEIWDQPISDVFAHQVLEANWNAIDEHDHSPTKGVQIPSSGLANSAVTQAKIAPNAVGQTQLQAGSVGSSQLQDGAVTTSKLATGAVLFGSITPDNVDPNFIPLGTIMSWWRPASGTGATVIPGGVWEICDGRAWSTITNAWGLITGHIPDLRGFFQMGADVNGTRAPAIGVEGGNSTVDIHHHHQVNNHHHHVGSHGHTIHVDGNHYHTTLGGYHLAMRANCLPVGLQFQDRSGNWQNNDKYSLWVQNWSDGGPGVQPSDLDTAGAHSHGGTTDMSDPNVITDDQSPDTDDQLTNPLEILPPYCALLFIMRVR